MGSVGLLAFPVWKLSWLLASSSPGSSSPEVPVKPYFTLLSPTLSLLPHLYVPLMALGPTEIIWGDLCPSEGAC